MFNYMRASREKSAFSCLISGPFSNSNNVVLASLLLQLSNFFFACSTRSNCKFMVEKLFLFEMFYCYWWNGSNPLLFCSYLLPSSTTTLRDYLKGECISWVRRIGALRILWKWPPKWTHQGSLKTLFSSATAALPLYCVACRYLKKVMVKRD